MPARLLFATICAAAFASPLAAFDINTMSKAERETFRAEVRAYLMDNPEVILEVVGILEQRNASEQATADSRLVAENAEALFDDGYSWVGGNPDGDITIVEFVDYRCGYCKRAHPEVNDLITTDGNIRYVIKEFPILGEESLLASKFAMAVKEVEGDSAYFQAHDNLMRMRGNVTPDALSDLSERLNFKTSAVLQAMNSNLLEEQIAANHALAQQLGINGTPSFVFETQLLRGYMPLDTMRNIVTEERGAG